MNSIKRYLLYVVDCPYRISDSWTSSDIMVIEDNRSYLEKENMLIVETSMPNIVRND